MKPDKMQLSVKMPQRKRTRANEAKCVPNNNNFVRHAKKIRLCRNVEDTVNSIDNYFHDRNVSFSTENKRKRKKNPRSRAESIMKTHRKKTYSVCRQHDARGSIWIVTATSDRNGENVSTRYCSANSTKCVIYKEHKVIKAEYEDNIEAVEDCETKLRKPNCNALKNNSKDSMLLHDSKAEIQMYVSRTNNKGATSNCKTQEVKKCNSGVVENQIERFKDEKEILSRNTQRSDLYMDTSIRQNGVDFVCSKNDMTEVGKSQRNEKNGNNVIVDKLSRIEDKSDSKKKMTKAKKKRKFLEMNPVSLPEEENKIDDNEKECIVRKRIRSMRQLSESDKENCYSVHELENSELEKKGYDNMRIHAMEDDDIIGVKKRKIRQLDESNSENEESRNDQSEIQKNKTVRKNKAKSYVENENETDDDIGGRNYGDDDENHREGDGSEEEEGGDDDDNGSTEGDGSEEDSLSEEEEYSVKVKRRGMQFLDIEAEEGEETDEYEEEEEEDTEEEYNGESSDDESINGVEQFIDSEAKEENFSRRRRRRIQVIESEEEENEEEKSKLEEENVKEKIEAMENLEKTLLIMSKLKRMITVGHLKSEPLMQLANERCVKEQEIIKHCNTGVRYSADELEKKLCKINMKQNEDDSSVEVKRKETTVLGMAVNIPGTVLKDSIERKYSRNVRVWGEKGRSYASDPE